MSIIARAEPPVLAACLLCTGYPDTYCPRCKNNGTEPAARSHVTPLATLARRSPHLLRPLTAPGASDGDSQAPVVARYAVTAAGAR